MSSLRRKLVVPNLALALVVGGGLGYLAVDSALQARIVGRRTAEVRETSALVYRLNQLAGDGERAVLSFRFRNDPRLLARIAAADEEAGLLMASLGGMDLSPRGRVLWSDYVASRDALVRERERLLAAVRGGDEGEVGRAFERWTLTAEKATALLADFSVFTSRQLDRTVDELDARRTRELLVLTALVGLAAVLAAAFAWYASRRIVRPLGAMTAAVQRIAAEKLASPVQGAEREDEIGVLARAFNQTTGELVRANERLANAVRARDEFLSVASHELRTPLTALKLQLEMALRELRRPAARDVRPRVDRAHGQVLRLEGLVQDLLDVTRIQAGRLALRTEPLALSALVADIVGRFGAELERAGNAVALSVEPGVVGRWDRDRLDQVVTNLVANAVRHAPGAPVAVSLSRGDGWAVLVVRDEGPGIPAEAQGRIFERFERAGDPRHVGGLGLGLFIVRRIVEAHGGTVRVQSGEGRGCAFTVELPLGEAVAEARDPATA